MAKNRDDVYIERQNTLSRKLIEHRPDFLYGSHISRLVKKTEFPAAQGVDLQFTYRVQRHRPEGHLTVGGKLPSFGRRPPI